MQINNKHQRTLSNPEQLRQNILEPTNITHRRVRTSDNSALLGDLFNAPVQLEAKEKDIISSHESSQENVSFMSSIIDNNPIDMASVTNSDTQQVRAEFIKKLQTSMLFSSGLVGTCIAFNKTTNDATSGLISTVSTMTNLLLTADLLKNPDIDTKAIMTHFKANTTFEIAVNLLSMLGGTIKDPQPKHITASLGLAILMNMPNLLMEAKYLQYAGKKPTELYHHHITQQINDMSNSSDASFSSGSSQEGRATTLTHGTDNVDNYQKIKDFSIKISGLISTLLIANNSIFPHSPVGNAILEGYLMNIAVTTLSEKGKIPFSGNHNAIKPGMAEKFTTAALASVFGAILADNDFSKTTAGKLVFASIICGLSLSLAHNMDKIFTKINTSTRQLINRNENNNPQLELPNMQNTQQISISNLEEFFNQGREENDDAQKSSPSQSKDLSSIRRRPNASSSSSNSSMYQSLSIDLEQGNHDKKE